MIAKAVLRVRWCSTRRLVQKAGAATAALLVSVAGLLAQEAAEARDATWWSYRPLQRPAPPAGHGATSPIDAFIRARLAARGLTPAPRASDEVLIRRVHYVLTGLPPTPEQVAAYTADESADKYEALVDKLLDSPQYGVNHGRHWLDLVRFAETDSFERDRKKPGAWRYRDWVIDALNDDVPYGEFLTAQLAGDELPDAEFSDYVATGYHRLGIWDDEPTDPMQAVYDDLDGIVDTTARVTMATSMGCARCHDHKKDPIPTVDYYRMLSFFEGLKPYKVGGGNGIATGNYVRDLPVDLGERDFAAELDTWRRQRDEAITEARNLADEALGRLPESERVQLAASRTQGLALHVDETLTDPREVARPVQDDFTLSLWFRTDRPGRGHEGDPRWFLGSGLLDGEVPGIVDDFGVSLIGSRVTAGVGRPETFVASPAGYADGAWHHVAFTRHRESGRIALYVDGERVGQRKGGKQSLTTNASLWIGRMAPGGGKFPGEIRDVRCYDRVLADRDVLDVWQGGGFGAGVSKAVAAKVGEPERARYDRAVQRVLELRRPTREIARVLCAQEGGRSVREASFVRERGNVHAKGEAVVPGFPQILGGGEPEIVAPADGESSGRRLAFARWLTRPNHPLTWRAIANRVWQHHFGRGLVRTPNDFGRLGEAPTHPELLDWLAVELVESGQRLKHLHRTILLSETWQQSSAPRAECSAEDPVNDLFWRVDVRRLTAEQLRDSMLAVTGELNLQMGGPGIYPKMPAEVLATASRPDQAWGRSPPEQANRRSVYVFVKRSLLMPLLQTFDLADTDSSCPVRFVTTLPTQALTLLNSDFANERAAALARRVVNEQQELPGQLVRGMQLVAQRQPTYSEIAKLIDLHRDLREQHGASADEALRQTCLALLNLNEFVYVD